LNTVLAGGARASRGTLPVPAGQQKQRIRKMLLNTQHAMLVCVTRPWAFAASCPGEEASDSGTRGHESTRALRLSIACGRGTRVQAEGAFDNINNKPDVEDNALSEAPAHAPGRRYRKPRLAASDEASGHVRGGVRAPFWADIYYHKGCLLCSHK
jgi:hypothetical protein